MALQEWKVTEPWLDLHCALGEGPFYETATQTVRFVDIKKKQLHTASLAEGPSSLKTLQLDRSAGVTADIEGVDPSERIVVGFKDGVAVLDRCTGTYEVISRFSGAAADDASRDNDRLRANDGAVDPNGRFWVGTMTDFPYGEFQPEGGHSSPIASIPM